MANLGFNQASHPMPMGGNVVQSSPFINSGGPYSGQGMPLHASAHMAPPQAYAAQVRAGRPMCALSQSLTLSRPAHWDCILLSATARQHHCQVNSMQASTSTSA